MPLNKSIAIEPLDPRRLFAGVTLLTHGQSGNVTGWIAAAANDIAATLGGSAAASIYTMVVNRVGNALAVTSFEPDAGYGDYRNTTSAEAIVKLDWSAVSDGSVSSGDVAEVTADYFQALRGRNRAPALAELPIHLVGHSRGASLVAEMGRLFGRRGLVVDQETFIDPHPVDGDNDIFNADFGDAPMRVYDNVVFADNYWRTDGNPNNFDFDGEAVTGAHNKELTRVQNNFFVSAHGAATAWYVGTIDQSGTNGGDHPIIPSWYDEAGSPRTTSGYNYSRILATTARPLDGVASLYGGAAARVSSGQSGAQWGNILTLKPRGGTSFNAGETLNLDFEGVDRDSDSSIAVFLDTDKNPYNGAAGQIVASTFDGDAGNRILSADTSNISPGRYYIAGRVEQDGLVRRAYGKAITIREGSLPPVGTITDGVLRVLGEKNSPNIIDVATVGGNIRVSLNGRKQTFAGNLVERVDLIGGSRNDNIYAATLSQPMYIFGDAGNDYIFGGPLNDTLTGGAGKNTVFGGLGDDRLSASGSPDLLDGGGGDDRIYGGAGDDTLAGGGNVDRIFGEDGNDLLVGANGNDKLYGNAGNDTFRGGSGSDFIDGGAGVDTSEDDDSDARTMVEVVG